jgi:hypothetical protein
MLGLQQGDKLHVLEVAGAPKNAQPMLHGVTVLLLNGREVGRGTLTDHHR